MASVEAFIAANRFGLGPRPGELARIAGDPRGWVRRQLGSGPAIARELSTLPPSAETLVAIAAARRADGAEGVQRLFRERLRRLAFAETNARTAVMVRARAPVRERLVKFWSNHFTVSAMRPLLTPLVGAYEREAIRPHVLGRFEDLLLAAVRHPAMLVYLDNVASVGPRSRAGLRTGRGLNENLAREVLELHTLGVNGGYRQDDVTELARMLTGWSHGAARRRGAAHGGFEFRALTHEPGEKVVLGRRYPEAGEAEGVAALRDLAVHPATARFVSTKLARHFVADRPPESAVERIARVFRDTRGDLPSVYGALVDIDALWRDPMPKVKTPYELVVATFRAVGFDALDTLPERRIAGMLDQLGHLPFRAPSPAGWPDEARAWISPQSTMRRVEWAYAVARRLPRTLRPRRLARDTIGPVASADTSAMVDRAPDQRDGLALVLASPEFQRR